MRRRPHLRVHPHNRVPAPEGEPTPVSPAAGPDDVAVAVAPPFTDRLADLGEVLGPGFTVAWGVPQATGLAVIRAASPTTVAFWRARHPACGLLVLDPLGEYSSAACLDAGADAYVAGPVTTAEVAAILRSLARRLVRLPQPA